MFGLDEKNIKKINKVFSDFSEIDFVKIYGSRAKGNYRYNSDIDITLEGNNITYNTLISVEKNLDDLLLPYRFDVSIFNSLENKELISHINRIGFTLYEKEKVY